MRSFLRKERECSLILLPRLSLWSLLAAFRCSPFSKGREKREKQIEEEVTDDGISVSVKNKGSLLEGMIGDSFYTHTNGYEKRRRVGEWCIPLFLFTPAVTMRLKESKKKTRKSVGEEEMLLTPRIHLSIQNVQNGKDELQREGEDHETLSSSKLPSWSQVDRDNGTCNLMVRIQIIQKQRRNKFDDYIILVIICSSCVSSFRRSINSSARSSMRVNSSTTAGNDNKDGKNSVMIKWL